MSFLWTRIRHAASTYRQSKISDRFQLLITKKEVECDYVAIDTTALIAMGLRLAKNVSTEQRRHKEVARHVSQSLQQLLKKIRCKKSLLIAMDGAETLYKADRTRNSSVTRKLESRLLRLPGTPLMQAVEERIVKMMPERQILPSEVIFAGTCVHGCVEQKMSAWALDIASRESFNGSTDSLCLIGASELYLNVMGLSPFYNISSVVQNNADLRQMRLQDILEWLELDKKAREGESVTIAKMRTDILFLFIIANGASATELNPLHGVSFHELVDFYMKTVKDIGLDNNTSSSSSSMMTFLFEDSPGNTLRLNIPLLCRIMQLVARKEVSPRLDNTSDIYLEQALQTHAMLCLGESLECTYLPSISTPQIGSTAPGVAQLAGHLNALCNSSQYRIALRTEPRLNYNNSLETLDSSSTSDTEVKEELNLKEQENKKKQKKLNNNTLHGQPLTAAEYTILCQSLPATVEGLIQHYIGVAPKPEVGKMITTADTVKAHQIVREVLSFANSIKPHKCLCLSPSYCWLQSEKTQLWRFEYVDIGVRSHQLETRRLRNAVKGVTLEVNMSRDGPSYFSIATNSWEPVALFPCGAENENNNNDNNNKQQQTIETGKTEDIEKSTIISSLEGEDKNKESITTTTTTTRRTLNETNPNINNNKSSSDIVGSTIEVKTQTRMPTSKQTNLKILTWNVMFDRYSGKPTPLGMPGIDWCSTKRYPVIAKLIQQEDADVVGMQEVEPVFWEFLSKQPWLRENYYFSCGYNSPAITPWGVLMLVHRKRFPIQNITYLNVPAWTNHVSLMPVVSLQISHGIVNIAAAHLLAPYTKSHETARTSQDSSLRHHMIKTLTGDVITMGDFNDWPTNEFIMPAESQYTDCWPVLHPNNSGKTMDETNTFCKLKVEEMFFGRSDKVFLRSRRLTPIEAHLVGTKSVNDENGNKEAPAYLFPSDHYGVSMTFTLKR